eukprot:3919426-Pyramimonas_sp.AAC.1
MQMLKPLSQVFAVAEKLARLTLKTMKCKIVPLAEEFSAELQSRVHLKLLELVPRWEKMQIVPMAEYLGVLLGPA